jgi:hypothetical protein
MWIGNVMLRVLNLPLVGWSIRSAPGELVYKLKYRSGPLNEIVDTADAFVTQAASVPRKD